jgi:hypothetical protein
MLGSGLNTDHPGGHRLATTAAAGGVFAIEPANHRISPTRPLRKGFEKYRHDQ